MADRLLVLHQDDYFMKIRLPTGHVVRVATRRGPGAKQSIAIDDERGDPKLEVTLRPDEIGVRRIS